MFGREVLRWRVSRRGIFRVDRRGQPGGRMRTTAVAVSSQSACKHPIILHTLFCTYSPTRIVGPVPLSLFLYYYFFFNVCFPLCTVIFRVLPLTFLLFPISPADKSNYINRNTTTASVLHPVRSPTMILCNWAVRQRSGSPLTVDITSSESIWVMQVSVCDLPTFRFQWFVSKIVWTPWC